MTASISKAFLLRRAFAKLSTHINELSDLKSDWVFSSYS